MRLIISVLVFQLLTGLIIFLFIYTATDKLLNHRLFVAVLGKSPIISVANQLLGIVVPVVEYLTAGLLIFDQTRRIGLWLSMWLMSLFTLYIAYMLLSREQLPCSCGGVLETLTWKQHLIFNILIILTITILLHIQKVIVATNRDSRKPA